MTFPLAAILVFLVVGVVGGLIAWARWGAGSSGDGGI